MGAKMAPLPLPPFRLPRAHFLSVSHLCSPTCKSKVTGELKFRPESSPLANWCSKRSSSVSGPQRARVSRCTEGGSSWHSPENCGETEAGLSRRGAGLYAGWAGLREEEWRGSCTTEPMRGRGGPKVEEDSTRWCLRRAGAVQMPLSPGMKTRKRMCVMGEARAGCIGGGD